MATQGYSDKIERVIAYELKYSKDGLTWFTTKEDGDNKVRSILLFLNYVLHKACSTGKWFEPRGISYWFVVIFRVRIAFRKTVVGD